MKWMDQLVLFSHVFESGVCSLWIYIHMQFFRAISMKHINHIKRLIHYPPTYFFYIYHLMMLDGEWIHGTCLGEESFNVMNLVVDRSVCQLRGQ